MGSGSGAGIGTALGGAAGFALGGPAGAMVGAQLGAGIGGSMDQPKVNTSSFRPGSGEKALVQNLLARQRGEGESVAETQNRMMLNQANANAMGLAAAQRGIAPGLAARIAAQTQGQQSMQANQAGTLARAQEQQGIDQLLASIYSSQRGSAGQAAQMQANAEAASRQQTLGLMQGIGQAGMAYMGAGGGKTSAPSAPATPAPTTSSYSGGYLGNYQLTPGLYDGGKVPGDAPVKGNHPKNDIVDAKLSPGEIVIPRTHAKDPDKAKAFVESILSKGKESKSSESGDDAMKKLLKSQQEMMKRLKSLEKSLGKEG